MPLKLRLVCISDTHNHTTTLPTGDILLHAGDLTNAGTPHELRRQLVWLQREVRERGFQAAVVVAGNHDRGLDGRYQGGSGGEVDEELLRECEAVRAEFKEAEGLTYLCHESAILELELGTDGEQKQHVNVKVFASPFSIIDGPWAFRQQSGEESARLWDAIPNDTDVLVTHGPPWACCDTGSEGTRRGCEGLLKAFGRVRPLLHVCGHVHEGRGAVRLEWQPASSVSEASCLNNIQCWNDPTIGSKKLSLLDLTFRKGRDHWTPAAEEQVAELRAKLDDIHANHGETTTVQSDAIAKMDDSVTGHHDALKAACTSFPNRATCVVNAAMMAHSYRCGPRTLNKPVVVDVWVPAPSEQGVEST